MISWVLIFLALFFLLIGYLIKFKLIAGLTSQESSDPYKDSKRLGLWLGSQWIFLGIFGLITTAIGFFLHDLKIKLMQAFLIMTIIVIIRIQRGVKKFY